MQVARPTCNSLFEPPATIPPRDSLICASPVDGQTCGGDSGGYAGSFRNGYWFVDGVTSATPPSCSGGISVFTSVPYFYKWIRDTTNGN